LRLALASAALLPIALSLACGDSALPETDPQYAPIAGLIGTAAENYASQGPAALYPYMASHVKAKCTQDQFVTAVGTRSDVGSLRSIEKVTIDGDEATATLTLITASGDTEVEWRLKREVTGSWGVLEVPGSERCAP
jgi:hypothetical protein